MAPTQKKPGTHLGKLATISQKPKSKQLVNMITAGALEVIKVKVKTSYNVCHDAVVLSSDFNNFWILENSGDYWHWLENSLKTKDDKENKPEQIPITLEGEQYFEFQAVFKVHKALSAVPQIKVKTNQKGGYTFNEKPGQQSGEFILKFTSTDKPYNGTIQYFNDFYLNFEYSIDGGNKWFSCGVAKFSLYLTWKKPGSNILSIVCDKDNKTYIYESLLWIGCKQAQGKISDEPEILDKVFEDFKDRKVIRRREGRLRPDNTPYFIDNFKKFGLGYWRGNSSLASNFLRSGGRFKTVLLAYGEGRCGEWTYFFLYIGIAMGANLDKDTMGIGTSAFRKYTQVSPAHINKFTGVFCVKDAVISKINDFSRLQLGVDVVGKSKGQGNDDAQPTFADHFWFYYKRESRFFDASYGVKYDSTNSNIKTYCADNLTSITVADSATSFSIVKSDIHNYIMAQTYI